MRRSNRWTDCLRRRLSHAATGDEGSAPLEFVVAGVVLLVPLVYLVIALGLIQGHTLGVEAGSRHIARSIATASDAAEADRRAEAVLASVVEDYGLDREAVTVTASCRTPGACPAAGATLVVTVSTRVALPLVPAVLGLDRFASIPLQASSAQKVSRFWGVG